MTNKTQARQLARLMKQAACSKAGRKHGIAKKQLPCNGGSCKSAFYNVDWEAIQRQQEEAARRAQEEQRRTVEAVKVFGRRLADKAKSEFKDTMVDSGRQVRQDTFKDMAVGTGASAATYAITPFIKDKTTRFLLALAAAPLAAMHSDKILNAGSQAVNAVKGWMTKKQSLRKKAFDGQQILGNIKDKWNSMSNEQRWGGLGKTVAYGAGAGLLAYLIGVMSGARSPGKMGLLSTIPGLAYGAYNEFYKPNED